VVGNSFAEEIGLREGDVIVSINRHPVASKEDILRIQAMIPSGAAVGFRVLRPLLERDGSSSLITQYFAGRMP